MKEKGRTEGEGDTGDLGMHVIVWGFVTGDDKKKGKPSVD